MLQWSFGATSATRVSRLLCALTLALFAVLIYELALRFIFPWDLYIWSESPFMTNMMKLSSGSSPFSTRFDANSFVYSPGLEYICFALLRPLGIELDVRACRAVVILVGFAASACAAAASVRLYESVTERRAPLALRAFAFSTSALLLFHNFTSDVCHPDNLFILHAMAVLFLLTRAVSSGRYLDAVLAVGFASTGAFAKQTAVFSGIAAAAAMFFVARAIWPLWRRLALLAIAAVVTAGAVSLLRSSEDSRFFLFDVLMLHSVSFHRVIEILRSVTRDPHRMLLLLAAAVGLCRFVGSSSPRTGPLLGCWALVGIEVLPALGGYLKAMGSWNNFTIVDVWLGVVALPGTWALLEPQAEESSPDLAPLDQRNGFLAAALLAVLCIMLLPLKIPPSDGQYAFGKALDKAITADVQQGKRILLPHGAMPLIHAGMTEAPRDRSNSVLEMRMAGLDVPETKARLEMRYYSRIYLFLADWYGRDVLDLIERNYHEVAVLPGDRTPQYADDYLAGYGNYMRQPVRVLELNTPR